MADITKKSLQHLACLARLSLTDSESKRFSKDLACILEYVKKLQEVATDGVALVIGGSLERNVFNNDDINIDRRAESVNDAGTIISAFPQSHKGHLKVPPVFHHDA